MSREGRSKKPCPACHRKAKRYSDPDDDTRFYGYDRPTDGICADCAAALDEAQRLVARAERAAKRSTDRQAYQVPEMPHWMPYLPHGRPTSMADRDDEPGRTIQRLLCDLVDAVGEPAVVETERSYAETVRLFTRPTDSYAGSIGYKAPVLLGPAVATLFDQLEAAIATYGACAYEEGRVAGRRLLNALAAGELTVSDYDDRSVAEAKQYQATPHETMREQKRRRR